LEVEVDALVEAEADPEVVIIVEVQSEDGASMDCAAPVELGGAGFRFGGIGKPGIRKSERLRWLG